MEDVIIRRKGEKSEAIKLDKVDVNLLTSAEYLKSMAVEMPPRSEIPQEYEHEGEEVKLVLEGEIEIDVSGETYSLKEGDVMWHKSSAPHRVRNPSDKKAVYFSVNLSL
ncbi:cupin domain-containing protein [archaeon]|nr:cupin domain-containing protein [archaeon]